MSRFLLDASDIELAGFAFTLFHEGYETASTVLCFALYELARRPDIQERLYNEIVAVSARHDNKFTYEALQEMTYLDCVIQGRCHFFGWLQSTPVNLCFST